MAIQYAPKDGTVLICDFDGIIPEMTKRRPAVVLSSVSSRLAIVVPLSTTAPKIVMPWHYLLRLPEKLPRPYSCIECWVKGDMIAAVSFERLNIPFIGKDRSGKRIYQINQVPEYDLNAIRSCSVRAISGAS